MAGLIVASPAQAAPPSIVVDPGSGSVSVGPFCPSDIQDPNDCPELYCASDATGRAVTGTEDVCAAFEYDAGDDPTRPHAKVCAGDADAWVCTFTVYDGKVFGISTAMVGACGTLNGSHKACVNGDGCTVSAAGVRLGCT